ncbi:hypothetical protein [Chromatocurvus halotolerans]|uniref:hypothetical protein n=1 Tax=Chromatocurvus halotolerans TaxID=1132028 RepID=UPI001045F4B4|nr:hypothetical protein [Chromatocurvus halotolerans]
MRRALGWSLLIVASPGAAGPAFRCPSPRPTYRRSSWRKHSGYADNILTKDQFQAVLDARFAEQDAKIDRRFAEQDAKLDKRFADIDLRFTEQNTRFENRFGRL